jgi:hypothetical protein
MKFVKMLAISLVVIGAIDVAATAQLGQRLDFEINVPYRLRMQNIVLPEGKYILKRVNPNNISLFFLYREDLTRPPIAVVSTVPIGGSRFPDDAAVVWHIDEEDPRSIPIITGWHIPGYTGWEIVGVVPKANGNRLRVARRGDRRGYRR